jgi:hypothetical protein
MKDVPIVSAATGWTNMETGETIILYFNQVLWYGKKLDNSLINPNQVRYCGHVLSDDVTDKTRFFGIEVDDNIRIPFDMKGTIVSFTTRVPSQWELDNCRVVVMTDDSEWDPENVVIMAASSIVSQKDESCLNSPLHGISCVFDNAQFLSRMVSSVRVHNVATGKHNVSSVRNLNSDSSTIAFLGAKDRHTHVTVEEVARILHCGL